MSRRVRSFLVVLPVVLGLAFLPASTATASTSHKSSSSTSSTGWPKPIKPPIKVTIATEGLAAGEAAIAVAYYRGWYKKVGIDLNIVSSRSFEDVFPLLATGQLDYATGGLNANIFNAANSGVETKIVAGLEVGVKGSDPGGLFVAKNLVSNGTYTGLSSLKGMTIGVGPSLGSSTEFFVEQMLAKGGLTLSDVHVVALPFQEVAAALTNGSIQAAFEVEPFATQLIKEGIADREAIGDQIIPGALDLFLDMSPQFGLQHPNAADNFMYATLYAQRYYLDAFILNKTPKDQAGIINILAKYTNTPASDIQGDGFGGANLNGEFNLNRMKEFEEFFYQEHTLPQLVPNLNLLVDFSYAKWASARLGIHEKVAHS